MLLSPPSTTHQYAWILFDSVSTLGLIGIPRCGSNSKSPRGEAGVPDAPEYLQGLVPESLTLPTSHKTTISLHAHPQTSSCRKTATGQSIEWD